MFETKLWESSSLLNLQSSLSLYQCALADGAQINKIIWNWLRGILFVGVSFGCQPRGMR
jgi:hypothetical protein